jgi:DNA-directed RNA polymerase II subunit RPB1
LQLYNLVPDLDMEAADRSRRFPPWVVRFVFDQEKINTKHLKMDIIRKKIRDSFNDQIQIMASDDNAANQVMRLRVYDITDEDGDEEETACTYLKGFMDDLLNKLSLSGIPEISKVTFTTYEEKFWNPDTGEEDHEFKMEWDEKQKKMVKKNEKYWLIETDGVALQKVLGLKKIDHTRVSSNDI